MNKLRKKVMKFLLVSGVVCTLMTGAYAIDLVVPNNRAVVEGDGNNGFPFTESFSVRYQQVYDSSQFVLLGTNGGTINSIGLRYNGNYNTATMIYYSMAVRLSTTSRAVDNLSAAFADNMGADATVVFSGKFTLGVTPPPSDHQLHPWPFPLTIPFTVPFQYNPTNGNLLLDIQWGSAYLYPGNGPPWMDAVYASNDSVSRVYGYNISGTPTNGTPDTIGMVTLFDISPGVPPSPHLNYPRVSGTNLLFNARQGAPGTICYLLATTDLSMPMTNWFPVATNTFDVSGNCVFTNGMNTNYSSEFFRSQLQ
jgi:hypothetical protein